MRKIIQIATAYAPDAEFGDRVFALCDDGTVWVYRWSREWPDRWERLARVPQADPDPYGPADPG